jgi:hypothetical protein
MNVRVIVLIVLCLPSWAVLNVLGPIQWLQGDVYEVVGRVGLNAATLLAVAAFGGFFISWATTPLAMLMALIFVVTARSWRVKLACLVLGLSAPFGTIVGYYWLGGGMRA